MRIQSELNVQLHVLLKPKIENLEKFIGRLNGGDASIVFCDAKLQFIKLEPYLYKVVVDMEYMKLNTTNPHYAAYQLFEWLLMGNLI